MNLQIGADIFKRALAYPARQIAKNAGVNGSTVINKVSSSYIYMMKSSLLELNFLETADSVFG